MSSYESKVPVLGIATDGKQHLHINIPDENQDAAPFLSPRALPTPRMRLQKALALDARIDEDMLKQGWIQISRNAMKISEKYTLVTAHHRGEDVKISVYVVNSSRVHEVTFKSRKVAVLSPKRQKEFINYVVGKYTFDETCKLIRKKKLRARNASLDEKMSR